MIYVFGADPFENSPSSKALNVALREAGFKMSEIKSVNTKSDIPDNSWVISFGSQALAHLVEPNLKLSELRGQLVESDINESILVLPTYAPGYLYRNPELMWQWKEDLKLFKAVTQLG